MMRLPFLRGSTSPLLGWFGKLPAVGDFAGRGLPLSLREGVQGWFDEGMNALVQRHGDAWRDAYHLSPVWHFAMNAGVWDHRALLGCVAPSRDRIGRSSPLIALRSLEPGRLAEYLPPCSDWCYRTDALLRKVIADGVGVEPILAALQKIADGEAYEMTLGGDILSEPGIEGGVPARWFSWPDLPEHFAERARRSFWWAEPSPSQPPRQVIHNGSPDADLFELLMTGWCKQ